jgi:hypothetical protein
MHGKPRCDSGKHLFSSKNGSRTFSIFDSSSPVTFTKSIWPDWNDARGPDMIDVMSPQRRFKQSRNTRTSGRWQQIHLYCELLLYVVRKRVSSEHETTNPASGDTKSLEEGGGHRAQPTDRDLIPRTCPCRLCWSDSADAILDFAAVCQP